MPTPIAWNTAEIARDGDSRTVEVRAKWANYFWGGNWSPINSAFALDSGRYAHEESPWSIECPATAGGRFVVANDQCYDIHARSPYTVTQTPALVMTHPDASNVDAVLDPLEPWRVDYPGAFGDGTILRCGNWWGRGIRAVHEIGFTALPNGDMDGIVRVRVATNCRMQGWGGDPVDIAGGASFVIPNDPICGIATRQAVAWYRDSTGVYQYCQIEVMIERDAGAVMLTKIVPRWFIAQGLADGATVWCDQTSTFYPDADAESTSVDGFVAYSQATNKTYANVQGVAGNVAVSNATPATIMRLRSGTAANTYRDLYRGIFLFDTSALGGASISSATLGLYGNASQAGGSSWTCELVGSTPASNTDLATSDYGQTGTTKYATGIGSGSWVNAAYNIWTLNASGLAAINGSGVSKFGTRSAGDIAASAEFTTANRTNEAIVETAEASGTGTDPYLAVVTSGGGSTGAGNLLLLGVGA